MAEEVSVVCGGALQVKTLDPLKLPASRCHVIRSPEPKCQQSGCLCPGLPPTVDQLDCNTSPLVLRRSSFPFKTKLSGAAERRLEETCAPWRAWLRSQRRRASTSTCCRLIFHRDPSPAAPAQKRGTRGSGSTGRIMKGQCEEFIQNLRINTTVVRV